MIRIARLDLERWGHFEGRSLRFGAAGSLHVVFGPNEAGKSTTRRAVGALLFGVPERTGDTYGRPGADLRIGAALELGGAGGPVLEVVRRKGRKDTLLDADGAPLDPAPLIAALGGVTREVHAGLFEITHESLVEGGLELLAGQGAVGESLFAAAAGTSRLHGLMRRLEAEADDVFSTRPSKKRLNMLLAAHAEQLKVLRDASLRPPQWEQLSRALAELEKAYENAGAALVAVDRERARLGRLSGVLPLAAQRVTAARALDALGPLPVLPGDAARRREAAVERRRDARSRAAAAERDASRRADRLAELTVDEALLPVADDIDALHARASAVGADDARRADVAAQRAALSGRIDALSSSLAGALAGAPRAIDDATRARLESCLQEHAAVEQAVAATSEGVDDARLALARAEAAAAGLPGSADDAPLSAAIRAARAAGPVDEHLARARAEEQAARAAADAACSRMIPPAGSADVLSRLPIPSAEERSSLLEALLDAERVAAGLATEAEAIDDRVAVLRRDRARIATAAPTLEPAALTTARAGRDGHWSTLRSALLSGTPVDASATTTYESLLADADAVADTRLQHASDLARLASIEAELSTLARDATELTHRRARHAEGLTAVSEAWTAAWSPTARALAAASRDAALIPSPAQTGAWLAARDAVLADLATAASAAQAAATATALRDQHVAALRAALGDDGDGAPPALASLVALAETRLDALRDQAEQAGRAAEAVARTRSALEDAQAAAERARARRATWQDQWGSLRDGCGLAATLAPDDALAAVRGLEQATRGREQLAALGEELAAIDARREAFGRALAELVAAVAPALADEPPVAAAAVLHRRAAAARAADAERTTLAAAVAELEAEKADAEAVAAEADDELAALRRAAGAEDDEALVRREREVARAEELRAELARLDTDLARAGGAPADEVAAAVAALDADALPARLDELESAAARHREERDTAAEQLALAREELSRLERSDEAARARQEATVLEAEIQEAAERYARARLAQRILRDAIARFRSAHEGPLLARANQLFPALTCERYARLETDLDERDRDILVAVTATGARRRVDELSDGTREQLFLALRLAALERHAATAQPIPVVFDDVLLESDDDRAERILTALAELATHTQVIVLTHHRHLVDIATATIPADRLDLLTLTDDEVLVLPPVTPIAARVAAAPPTRRADDADDDRAPALTDAPREPSPTPTLAEELEAVGAGPRTTPTPYGEQTSFL